MVMTGLDLLLLAVAVLGSAYFLYGRYLAWSWGIDPARKTPTRVLEDGEEYVPSAPAVVFGHEFASIAGAGPINGPIIAAMFGWVPVLLWLLLGPVFFGAANQLLAALTLLACALFLKRSSRRVGMLALPTAIMLGVTYSALVLTITQKAGRLFFGGFRAGVDGLRLVPALLILGVLGFSCVVKLFAKERPAGGLE
jgi:carbon starvation protein CstA